MQISHLNYYRPVGDATEKLDYQFACRTKGAIDRAVSTFQEKENLRREAAEHWEMPRSENDKNVPAATPGASAEFSSFTGPPARYDVGEP